MKVLRADDTGELELSGTVAELRQLAQLLRSGKGRSALDTGGDPAPYNRTLESLAVERTTEKLVVSMSPDLASLQFAGDRDALESLASVLTDFAEEGDLSAHVHFEHLPGHEFLSPHSEPVVIALEA
jgi:hypothetical protein